jgi:hypothetical protein
MVTLDRREFEKNGYGVRFVEADLARVDTVERHDPKKLARTLMEILTEERERA